jgi:uncharacterized protein (TIGR00297 family)
VTDQTGVLLLSAGLNAPVVLAALWRKSLSPSGAVVGFLLGSTILFTGGFLLWGMLMLFFVSSSVMSRVGGPAKASLASMHEKGDERDGAQVLANGGAGLLGAILFAVTGEQVFAVAAAGGIAAANADTWASELGVLSHAPPRSVVTGGELPAGASGGVTRFGTLASVAGSGLIAIWFALWIWAQQASGGDLRVGGSPVAARVAGPLLLLVIVTGAGALGSFVDSLLGGTVQALYETEEGTLTERRAEGATKNKLIRGVRRVTNDVVNFVSTTAGALFAGVVALLAQRLGMIFG